MLGWSHLRYSGTHGAPLLSRLCLRGGSTYPRGGLDGGRDPVGIGSPGYRRLAVGLALFAPGPLYRPTVLETADNGFHFLSPPGEYYEITMPLAEGCPLIREPYIPH